MDKIHREYEFVQNIWKFMKACEKQTDRSEAFWEWAEAEGAKLEKQYSNMSFVAEWVSSFLKFVDEEKKQ